jgi:hypothetical protein
MKWLRNCPKPTEPDIAWEKPGPLGHPEAIQTAGTVAAPLLAGFSLTMVTVLLPTISKTSRSFGRWPDLSLGLLLFAAILLIMAVQFAMHARSYQVTPDELMSWWGRPGGRPSKSMLWNQKVHAGRNRFWARLTQWAYNIGILFLLAALPVTLLPPGHIQAGRWIVASITALGFIFEFVWFVFVCFQHDTR